MLELLSRKNIVNVLHYTSYALLILGVIILAIGVSNVLTGGSMYLYIIYGISCIISSFFSYGIKVIVQAASAYLDEKGIKD